MRKKILWSLVVIGMIQGTVRAEEWWNNRVDNKERLSPYFILRKDNKIPFSLGVRLQSLQMNTDDSLYPGNLTPWDSEIDENNSVSAWKKIGVYGTEFLVAEAISISWDVFAWSVGISGGGAVIECILRLPGDVLLTGPATWGVGKLWGQKSSLWKAMAGAGIGNILGVITWIYVPQTGLVTFFLLPPLGAVIGCNL